MEKILEITQLPGWEQDEAELVRSFRTSREVRAGFGRVSSPDIMSETVTSEVVRPVSARFRRRRRSTLSFLSSLFSQK